tara:strand:- start:4103 stop:5071 length:969 start_codon:yes stop_codon:yes gene_type:complete
MAVGDIIGAARYNTLQGRVATILGVGSGDKGYNNAVLSSPVAVGNVVTAEDLQYLASDYTKIYVHQTGSLPGGLIGTDVETRTISTDVGLIWDDLYAEYESVLTAIETNRFDINFNYASVEASGANSVRNTVWGGSALPQSIIHEFIVDFGTANARRGFFNAGGEIRFSASLTHSLTIGDPDYQKTVDWQSMLSSMQTVKFNYDTTDSYNLSGTDDDVTDDAITGAGTGSAIGNLDLTTAYQTIYTKTGSAAYIDNELIIQAKEESSSQIRFLLTFVDDANGSGGADERVNGTLTSNISHLRADSTTYVNNPAPSYSLITGL